MVDETSNDRKNKKQQQSSTTTKKESPMEEEIDLSTSSKQKNQEQKNLIRRNSGGQQQQQNIKKENSTPSPINTTTIQKEILDLPKVALQKKTTKTPSKDLNEQDLDKSLDDPAIIHEAQHLFNRIAEKLDPRIINQVMKKATQEKILPDDTTNMIISQQIEFGKLLTQRLVQMISIDDKLINEIYTNTGINNRKVQRNIKYAFYISAPILCIIRLQIQEMQKKEDERDQITICTYAMASLIALAIQEYLTKLGLLDDEDKMNLEGIQTIILNTFQKGTKNAYKMNHIIQLNRDEENPIFATINITKDNVTKFTKIN